MESESPQGDAGITQIDSDSKPLQSKNISSLK